MPPLATLPSGGDPGGDSRPVSSLSRVEVRPGPVRRAAPVPWASRAGEASPTGGPVSGPDLRPLLRIKDSGSGVSFPDLERGLRWAGAVLGWATPGSVVEKPSFRSDVCTQRTENAPFLCFVGQDVSARLAGLRHLRGPPASGPWHVPSAPPGAWTTQAFLTQGQQRPRPKPAVQPAAPRTSFLVVRPWRHPPGCLSLDTAFGPRTFLRTSSWAPR